MNQEENKGRRPDYSGDGVAVWKKLDKNGKEYLSVKVLGHYVNCFQVTQSTEEKVIMKEAGVMPSLD